MIKKNKIPILVGTVLTILTLLIVILCLIRVDDNKKNIYDINQVFVVELLGTENYGYANVTVNSDFLEQADIDLSDFKYKVSQKNMLSNGDIITITIEDTVGLKFNKTKLEYKISDLQEGTDLDIFKDLIVEYNEVTGKIVLDNSQCSQFIKENVLFSIKRELTEYKKGDIVEIIGYVDMNAATDNRYNILTTTYEYTVN